MSENHNKQEAKIPQAPSSCYNAYGFIISVLLLIHTLPGLILGIWCLCCEYLTVLGRIAKMPGHLQKAEAELGKLMKDCETFLGQENLAEVVGFTEQEY